MMNKRREILEMLLVYRELFPAQKVLSSKALDLLAGALEDIPTAWIEKALGICLKEADFFPTVAEIRRTVAALPEARADDERKKAAAAEKRKAFLKEYGAKYDEKVT